MEVQNNSHRIKDSLAHWGELQRLLENSDWDFYHFSGLVIIRQQAGALESCRQSVTPQRNIKVKN